MSLSNRQYEQIMQDYDRIRRESFLEEEARRERIYTLIPEIKNIDEEMASLTTGRARALLYGKAGASSCHSSLQTLIDRKRALLTENGYPADYLDPVFRCRDCRDTGYIGQDKCHCLQRRISGLLYDRSNLASVLNEENFDRFHLDYYSEAGTDQGPSPRENMEEVLRTCLSFVKHFPGPRPEGEKANLLLYGHAGTGKSFLSHCIADALLKDGHSVLYLTAHRFFELLADRTFRREETQVDALEDVTGCDLLIIDDLGTELNNAFVDSSLFLTINERLLAGRSTIINTNLSFELISERYSERIFSRIIDAFTPLHLFGEDIRVKKALASLDAKRDRML